MDRADRGRGGAAKYAPTAATTPQSAPPSSAQPSCDGGPISVVNPPTRFTDGHLKALRAAPQPRLAPRTAAAPTTHRREGCGIQPMVHREIEAGIEALRMRLQVLQAPGVHPVSASLPTSLERRR